MRIGLMLPITTMFKHVKTKNIIGRLGMNGCHDKSRTDTK